MRARWYRFLLRFGWRHKQGPFGLGCGRYLGTSVCGEPMWNCRLHGKDAL